MKRKIIVSVFSFFSIILITFCILHINFKKTFSKQTKDELIDSGYSFILPVFNSSTNIFWYSIDDNIKYKATINLVFSRGKADFYILKSDIDNCLNEEQLVSMFENDSKGLELIDSFSIDKEGEQELDFCGYKEGQYYLLIKCEDDTLDGQVILYKYYSRGYEKYCELKNQYSDLTDRILKINGIPCDSYKNTWDWEKNN